MRISSPVYLTVFLTLVLSLSACDKNIEMRSKLEKGKEKINLPAEIEAFGNYDKYHDKLFREKFMEQVEDTRKERRIERTTDSALKDGSLMEKFSGGGPGKKAHGPSHNRNQL